MGNNELWGEIIRTPAELACKLRACKLCGIIGYKLRPNSDGNIILEYMATEDEVDAMYSEYKRIQEQYNDGVSGFVI